MATECPHHADYNRRNSDKPAIRCAHVGSDSVALYDMGGDEHDRFVVARYFTNSTGLGNFIYRVTRDEAERYWNEMVSDMLEVPKP